MGLPKKSTTRTSGFLPTQQPVLSDSKAAEAWLSRAPLADPRQACHELTLLLESLEDVAPGDRHMLEILERLREPVVVAQAEHSKKFSGRPLPLKDFEAAAFDQVYDLWSTLGRAYRRLLRNALEDHSAELAGQEALLAQRAIDCVAELMLVHYRCRREVDADVWRDLHQLYHTAESGGYVLRTVAAGRKAKAVSSCAEVYIRALLLHLANPYGLGTRELAWARRWATMWAYKVDLTLAPEKDQGYAIDLTGNASPTWVEAASASPEIRFLDVRNLRRSIKSRIKKLDEGQDPQTLGLGKDAVQPEAGRLLASLLRTWIEAPASRQFTRRLVLGRTELTTGFESIHVALSGKLFKSASRHWDYSRRDAEQIHIYGTSAAVPDSVPGQAGFVSETWETLDESANGFRLRRKGAGERLYQLQLVALKPQGARSFILCEVRWLMVGIDRALTVGAQALPGLATAIAVRTASPPTPEPYVQAFLLPGNASAPGALVLPSGWYQRGRELEMRVDEQSHRVRLTGLIQHGYDYDRVSFSTSG
jgi:hypothetical protein